MKVNRYHTGLFSKTRCSFDILEGKDTNPGTKKIGIRCHNAITAFFLRLFGNKIVKIRTDNGKTIYLNGKSYENWLKWRRSTVPTSTPGAGQSDSTPLSLNQIIGYHKAVKQKKKDVKTTKKGAKKIAKLVSRAHKNFKTLKQKKKQKISMALISGITRHWVNKKIEVRKALKLLEDEKSSLEKTKETLRVERETIEGQHQQNVKEPQEFLEEAMSRRKALLEERGSRAWQCVQAIGSIVKPNPGKSALQNQIDEKLAQLSLQIQELQDEIGCFEQGKTKYIAAHTPQVTAAQERLQKLATEIQEKNKTLKELGKKIHRGVAGIFRLQVLRTPSEASSDSDEAPIGGKDAPHNKEPNAIVEAVKKKAFNDIGKHCHERLKKIMKTLFNQFDEDLIKSWTCDENGKFELISRKPGKIWFRSEFDHGELDKSSPKGSVVLICNNNSRRLKGRLEKTTITIDEGFDFFSKAIKFGLSDEVDGVLSKIECEPNKIDPSESAIITTVSAQTRNWPYLKKTVREGKKFRTVKKQWKNAETIPAKVDHVKFQRDKPTAKKVKRALQA